MGSSLGWEPTIETRLTANTARTSRACFPLEQFAAATHPAMTQQQTILKDDKFTFGVTDPTDWNSTRLPIVGLLDSALRCQICKDYYDTPVITKCSHTFCSRCIRRSLGAEQKCPMCRAAAQEIQLRRNGAAQELVDAFAAARPMLMQVATELVRKGGGAAEESNGGTQQPEEVGVSGPVARGGPERRVTRASSRPQSQQQQQQQPLSQVIVVSEEDDDEYKPPLPPPGMVACPICDQHVREKRINLHIDKGCPREQSPPTPKRLKYTNSFFGSKGHQSSGSLVAVPSSELSVPPLRPLPKIAFGLMKEPALRNKLHELGLPSHGTKKNLQDRYNEWLTLWNANVDSSRPRSKRELLMELHSWEAANSIPAVERTKVPGWSDQKWGNDHKDHFRDLIENAKRRKPKKHVEELVPEDVKKEVAVEVADDPSIVTADAGSDALQTTTTSTASPEIYHTAEQLELAGAVNHDTLAVGVPMQQDPIGARGPVVPGIMAGAGAELMLGDQNLLAPYGKRKFEEIEGGADPSGVHGP